MFDVFVSVYFVIMLVVVVGLFGSGSMYLLVCIRVLCTYSLLLHLLSLCLRYLPLIISVLVAFAYCS